MLDRAHGVEVLGHRHRQPGRPQLVHEALEHVEHHARPDARRHLELVARHRVLQLRRVERPRHHLAPQRRRRGVDELLARLRDVGLVLEQHVERVADHLRVDRAVPEVEQRAGPVDRLGDRRRLLHVERPDGAHDLGDLLGEVLVDLGHADPHDLLLPLELGVVVTSYILKVHMPIGVYAQAYEVLHQGHMFRQSEPMP